MSVMLTVAAGMGTGADRAGGPGAPTMRWRVLHVSSIIINKDSEKLCRPGGWPPVGPRDATDAFPGLAPTPGRGGSLPRGIQREDRSRSLAGGRGRSPPLPGSYRPRETGVHLDGATLVAQHLRQLLLEEVPFRPCILPWSGCCTV